MVTGPIDHPLLGKPRSAPIAATAGVAGPARRDQPHRLVHQAPQREGQHIARARVQPLDVVHRQQ